MSTVAVECFAGQAIEPHLSVLAALRIEVFREYPYLYEGSLAYEQDYLRGYAACPESVVVLARDAQQVVGASTALPLTAHAEGLAPVFSAAGIAPERVYYFGESVLKASHRGRGLGHAFFDQREAAARAHRFEITAFCAVERSDAHPARPPDYVPHDAFWQKRGYVKRSDLKTKFAWRDLGAEHETEKTMVFWLQERAS